MTLKVSLLFATFLTPIPRETYSTNLLT